MWKAERGYLGSHRGLVGKYKRLSGSRSMDSPYCSSCGRFGLGHIQEGGWERDLQLDPSGGGVEGINRLMVCLNWLPSLKRERGRGLMVVVCEIIHIRCTNQTFLIPPLSIKCKPSPARNQETETFRQAMDWLDLMIRTQMDKPPPPTFQSCIPEPECLKHRARRQWTLHSDKSQSKETPSSRWVSQSGPFGLDAY